MGSVGLQEITFFFNSTYPKRLSESPWGSQCKPLGNLWGAFLPQLGSNLAASWVHLGFTWPLLALLGSPKSSRKLPKAPSCHPRWRESSPEGPKVAQGPLWEGFWSHLGVLGTLLGSPLEAKEKHIPLSRLSIAPVGIFSVGGRRNGRSPLKLIF